MKHAADVVVVGAGVMGASIALELSRAGRHVIVVDKLGGPGQGSTSASSAVIRFNYSTFEGVAASWEAKHLWEKWADHLGVVGTTGIARFHRTGMVFLDVDMAPRARSVALMRQAGVPCEEWSADILATRLPGIDTGKFYPPRTLDDEAFWADAQEQLGAVFTPDAGFIDDPQLATVNLADAATTAGATFMFNRQVTAVRRTNDHVAGVDLAGDEEIDAPVVVNAAGPWSTTLNRLAAVGVGWTIGLRALRQEVHYVDAPPEFNSGERYGPNIADLDLGTYMRGAPGNQLLVGGTEPACDELIWVDDVDAANVNPTASIFEAQVTRAARRFPEMPVPNKVRGIAAVYDLADDWTPIYDRTELSGYYVAIGTSGNQFKNGPLVGKLIASIVSATEAGQDHDVEPVIYTGEHTGLRIDLSAFSRKRPVNTSSTGTVMG